jgi:hypothetical protein
MMITLAKRMTTRSDPKMVSVNENHIVYIEETTATLAQGESAPERITRVQMGDNCTLEVSNSREEIDRMINNEHLKWLEAAAKIGAQWSRR